MEDEAQPRWKAVLKAINARIEYWLDLSLDHMGCTIGCIVVFSVLFLVLLIGLFAYDSYIHRNQHCVLAHREYVMVGKVLTQEDICDQWQNN
jgi:hypothetical protein